MEDKEILDGAINTLQRFIDIKENEETFPAIYRDAKLVAEWYNKKYPT